MQVVESASLEEFEGRVLWLVGTWLRSGLGSAGGMVRLNDCKGLFQPNGSMTYAADTSVYIHIYICAYIFALRNCTVLWLKLKVSMV